MRLTQLPRALAPLGLAAALSAGLWASGCDEADLAPSACATLSTECPAQLPSYASEIAPLIATHCGQCHTREDPNGPWPLDDPTDVADWASAIKVDVSDCLMPPPETDVPMPDADRQTLFTWLQCGAPVDAE
jgi:hypothetical protein